MELDIVDQFFNPLYCWETMPTDRELKNADDKDKLNELFARYKYGGADYVNYNKRDISRVYIKYPFNISVQRSKNARCCGYPMYYDPLRHDDFEVGFLVNERLEAIQNYCTFEELEYFLKMIDWGKFYEINFDEWCIKEEDKQELQNTITA